MSNQATQTPLIELARNVPNNLHSNWASQFTEDGHAIGYNMAPDGRYLHELADKVESLEADHEKAVSLVIEAGIATGHADTSADLMAEVLHKVGELRAENAALLRVLKENHIRLHIGKAGTSWWVVPRADWERAKDLPVILDLHVQEQKG